MIRALIFDCFGVLYSNGRRHIESLCPPEKLTELNDIYIQSDYGYIERDEFIKGVSELAGISENDFKAIEKERYIRNEPLMEYIRSKKSDYKIGLLSNVGKTFIGTLFTAMEQGDIFDAFITSSSVGLVKPSPEIYELTAQKLGLLPEECVFVDDIMTNVVGAEKVGMSGVQFLSNSQVVSALEKLLGSHNA